MGMHPAILTTAARVHFAHNYTGRALPAAANDCPSDRLILSPVHTSSPGVRAVDSPSAGAAFPVAAQSLRAGRDPVTEFSHYSQIHK